MIFTGQVRVPEVDHPGVPATFVVEDDQAEVLLDGESLGRWSLFDVHASRLVSAAFSVSLAGDEITFIADEPVDFAYKGVDHMAESWARYKAMTLPRRMIAVGRSRRGTHPSRVAELREAMLANLEAQRVAEWAQEAEDVEAAAPPVAAPPPPPPPPPPPAPVLPPVEAPAPPPAADALIPPATADESDSEVRSVPIRPGPGLVARLPVDEPTPPAPEVDPIAVFRPEPVVSVPAEMEPVEMEPVEMEPVEMEPVEMEPASIEWPEPNDVIEPIEAFEPEPVEIPEPVAVDEHEPEPVPAISELVSELLDTSSDDDREETPKRLVVDLGVYEVPPDPASTPTQPRVPALAATAPAADKSGIFGAVRAAFVRNKGSHEHEFVEAPGGIGIHRNICSECGYISIGVSQSDTE